MSPHISFPGSSGLSSQHPLIQTPVAVPKVLVVLLVSPRKIFYTDGGDIGLSAAVKSLPLWRA